MTSYQDKGEKPEEKHSFTGYDHIHFWVSNAKQVASYYMARFGFEYIAYRGLETGSRDYATHVIRQNKIIFAFSSPLNPVETDMGRRIMIKGDAVKDVAFGCKDAAALYEKAIARGAVSIKAPTVEKDEDGTVVLATVQTYGDVTHTFVQRGDYKGVFLPGYKTLHKVDPLGSLVASPRLDFIDHIVGNQGDLEMNSACEWYEKVLGFHRFWSVDDSQIHSEYSALRSIVMTDYDEVIKMPINEPAAGKKKSQIQEFVEYHGGAGVQHIALNCDNILHALPVLRSRGLEFLSVPDAYYEDVKRRLAKSPLKVAEDIDALKAQSILIDFDDQGYLLQIFTKPQEDRPTLFYEVIQRRNHTGFGAGNFKALFESIEREQAERGNLENDKPAAAAAKA